MSLQLINLSYLWPNYLILLQYKIFEVLVQSLTYEGDSDLYLMQYIYYRLFICLLIFNDIIYSCYRVKVAISLHTFLYSTPYTTTDMGLIIYKIRSFIVMYLVYSLSSLPWLVFIKSVHSWCTWFFILFFLKNNSSFNCFTFFGNNFWKYSFQMKIIKL